MMQSSSPYSPLCGALRRAFGRGNRGWVAVAALLLWPATTAASPWDLRVYGSVTGAWSDNVDTASGTTPGMEAQSGFYTQVQPSLLFTYQTPRTVHTATGSVGIFLYQTDLSSPTLSPAFSHNSLIALSPTTELGVGSSLNFGRFSDLLGSGSAAVDSDPGAVSGESQVLSVGINQSFNWQATQVWRFSQGTSAAVTTADIEGRESYNAGLSLGIERAWTRTALGVNSNIGYFTTTGQSAAGEETTIDQLSANLAVTVRRDLSEQWSGSASLGIAALTTLNSEGTLLEEATTPTPTAGLSASYWRPMGLVIATFNLSATNSLQPNALVGTVTNNTGATAQASVPLPWLRRGTEFPVQVSSSLGVTHSRLLGAAETGNWNSYTASAALQWSLSSAVYLSLQYQYAQSQTLTAAMSETPADSSRNTVLLTLSGRYPTQRSAAVPDRTPIRVDRSNEAALVDSEAN